MTSSHGCCEAGPGRSRSCKAAPPAISSPSCTKRWRGSRRLATPTAKELAEDLKRFQTGKLVTAHDYSAWTLARRWLKRYRAAVAVAGIGVCHSRGRWRAGR